MLLFLWLLMYFIKGDNLEFSKHEFDTIYCIDRVIHSKDMKYSNNIKISFVGDLRLEIFKVRPKIFVVYNRTCFISNRRPLEYRLDFEYRVLGLGTFVWPFIAFSTAATFLAVLLIKKLFNAIDQQISGIANHHGKHIGSKYQDRDIRYRLLSAFAINDDNLVSTTTYKPVDDNR